MEEYLYHEAEEVIVGPASPSATRLDMGDQLYHKVEALIYSASLSALEHSMLLYFVEHAVDLDEAARFIIDEVSRGSKAGTSAEQTLLRIKEDLTTLARRCFLGNDDESPHPNVEAALHRRQRGRCYMSGCDTGLRPTYIISPSIKNDREIKPGVRSSPHLSSTNC